MENKTNLRVDKYDFSLHQSEADPEQLTNEERLDGKITEYLNEWLSTQCLECDKPSLTLSKEQKEIEIRCANPECKIIKARRFHLS